MNPDPSIQPFRFGSPQQERIYRRLLLLGRGPASFYRDICRLLSENAGLESITHLVGHLYREIESALRIVLLSAEFKNPGKSNHKAQVLHILKTYEIDPKNNPPAKLWLEMTDKGGDFAPHRAAHRDGFGSPRSDAEWFSEFCSRMDSMLDYFLDLFETHFTGHLDTLDKVFCKSFPKESDKVGALRTIKAWMPQNGVTLDRFFEKIPDASWLGPLEKEGFFVHPPPPEMDDEKGTIGFSIWPASRYLVRIAKESQEAATKVTQVIIKIPKTKNVRVYDDYADAALGMPPDVAAQLIDEMPSWIDSPYLTLVPDKLEKLLLPLVKGQQMKAAIAVAELLLDIAPGDKTQKNPVDPHRAPKPRIREWDYQQTIQKAKEAFVGSADPVAVLNLFCRPLKKALDLEIKHRKTDHQDFSEIWRRTIEPHPYDRDMDFKNHLVSAIRDAAEELLKADSSGITEIVNVLEEYKWDVFRRIALYLLRKHPNAAPDLRDRWLISRSIFDQEWYEYQVLAAENFNQLSEEKKSTYLRWVERGPDLKEIVKRDPQYAERYLKAWQRTRLSWIKDHLSDFWKQRYEKLMSEVGQPEPIQKVFQPTFWHGPTSPKTATELKAMTPEAVIEFLWSWQPPSSEFDHSREGLSRALTTVVEEDPDAFVGFSNIFHDLDPTYVRGIIAGWSSAIRSKRPFDWSKVLELCQWVVNQPRGVAGRTVRTHVLDSDSDWGPTRMTIARLLESGLKTAENRIPQDMRNVIWSVLNELMDDPDPSIENEKERKELLDPWHESVNTTRGVAMHAVFEYAFWVRNGLLEQGISEEELKRDGFKRMPEVQAMLERSLNPELEKAATVRSVFGEHFPRLLVYLDRTWTEQYIKEIFPISKGHDLSPAWRVYIMACPPYDESFAVLTDQYAQAIDNLEVKSASNEQELTDFDERLAHHIMMFALRGLIDLDDPNNLLDRFWKKAPARLRASAIEFIGRRFWGDKEEIPAAIVERAKSIWSRRLKDVGVSVKESRSPNELGGFGWWFASERFDSEWALPQLLQAIKLTKGIKADDWVVGRLAKIAPAKPREAVEALTGMIEQDAEGWAVQGYQQGASEIIMTARDSGNSDAQTAAIALIQRLVARGHGQFRTLLPLRDN